MTNPPRGKAPAAARLPQTSADLQAWVRDNIRVPDDQLDELFLRIDEVLTRQQRLWEESKNDALKALCEGFGEKMERLQQELLTKDTTVSNIARYFEELVTDLTERSRRDPKTKLMNFDWFMERLESFLAIEQRVRWCAVGVVDIASFKWYNDNLGHALGDQIIEQVSRILAEQIRSEDLLTQDRVDGRHDLHARFGGDEFSFLIPDLPGPEVATVIAERFKQAVERFDWMSKHERLALKPVRVDVGVVSLQLGPVAERRGVARKLAADLMHQADILMYGAKGKRAGHVYPLAVRIEHGELVIIAERTAIPFRRNG